MVNTTDPDQTRSTRPQLSQMNLNIDVSQGSFNLAAVKPTLANPGPAMLTKVKI